MPPKRVDVISSEIAFQGHFRVDRHRLRVEQHAGGMGSTMTREVFERGRVAAVLPVDPDREQVVLIEQFRPGAWACGWQPWLLECVAGIIEPGETPEAVCRREAEEESGCRITDLVPIATPFLSSPGACSETVALFCGRVDASGAGGLHGLDEEHEDIRVDTYGIDEALALLDGGRIVNAKTIIALQWLALNRERVLARWRGDGA